MHEAEILLVENNTMDVELMFYAFSQVNLKNKVDVVRTGEEALDYVFARGKFADRKDSPLPDLILLDLKLPGISGFEVLAELKAKESSRRIPVIILTSSLEEGDRAMCYDCGANSYLVKPVEFAEFAKLVRTITDYWLTLNVGPPKS